MQIFLTASFPFYSTSGLIYGIHFAFQGESKTVTQLSLVHSRQLDRPCLSVRVACDNVTKFISSVYVHWDNNVVLGPVPHHNGSVHLKGWKVDNPPPFLGIVSVTWSAKKCTQPIGMSVHLTPLGFPVLWITLHCVFKSFLFQWTASHRIFPHLKKPPRYYPLCKYISGFICHVEVQPMFLNKLPITVQSTLCKKLTQEFTHNAQGSPVATNTQGDKTSEINCFPWPVQEHPCVRGRQLWCNYTGWQLSPLPENVVYKHSAHSVR